MRSIALTVAVLLGAYAAHPQEIQRADLIAKVQSPNSTERALARQLLPRYGIAAAQDLLLLLGHADEAIWRTASNTLKDIAYDLSAPGHADEQRVFSELLLARLATRPPADQTARILDTVYIALPNGVDVQPIAALMDDLALRMKAREALQLSNTPETRAALRHKLSGAEGLFALALIDSLGSMQDTEAYDLLAERLQDNDPAVRARAASALSWTGDAAFVETYRRVIRKADPETYIDAGDAYLRLTDAIMQQGGRYDFAIAAYEWALQELGGPVLKGAAIAALGRYGDERVVPLIMETARNANGALDHAALEAFAIMQGRVADEALLENHDRLFDTFGPYIYAAYGRRDDPRYLPLILRGLYHDVNFSRHVAQMALLDTNNPEAIREAARYGASLDGEERKQLLNQLQLKAVSYQALGSVAAASEAFAGAYRLAETNEDRDFALEGIMRFPSEESFILVTDLVGEDQWDELPITFLAGIARALRDSGRPEDAEKILDALLPRLSSPADIQAYLSSAPNGGREVAKQLGFITSWNIAGPFPWNAEDGFTRNHINAPNVDLNAIYTIANGDKRGWMHHETGGPDGIVHLIGILDGATQATAYAHATVQVAETTEALVRMGSDDGVKAWVNGKVVHENAVDRGLLVDQDIAPITLKAGSNDILIEVTQGAGGWAICARLTDANGRPLDFEQ